MAEERNVRGRRLMLGCLGILLGVVVAVWVWLGPLLMTVQRRGFLEPQLKTTYEGGTMENLRAIHTALMQYHDSEGAFPMASGWMDATWPYLKTADLTEEEAKKKLRSPSLWETNPTAFGYAFNEDLSQVFNADVVDPAITPLVFDSSDLSWNAHGQAAQLAPSPARPEGNWAVTVEGSVVKLDELLRQR